MKALPLTILEQQFPVPRNTAASKIGNGVISLLCELDVIATLIITNTAVMKIFQNLEKGDVVYAQTWEVLTLKKPIEPR